MADTNSIDSCNPAPIKELLKRAESALEDEAYLSAVDHYRCLSSINPSSASAHIGLGDAYFGLGDYDSAEAAYRDALDLEPNNGDGLFNLAATLRVTECYDEAIEFYYRAFETEPDRIAVYWELAYSLEMIGNTDAAEKAYNTCLDHDPDHGMARHLLAAMLSMPTDRAPDDYVRDLFNDYASSFEKDLLEDLNYVVPDLIRRELEDLPRMSTHHKHRPYATALDLGCGTGLVAESVKNLVGTIEGVDLSDKMVAIAQERQRYAAIYVEEMTSFLTNQHQGYFHYDLILCGDSLVYLGDLKSLFLGVKCRLNPTGVFCFTLETLARGGFKLRQTGRYAHSHHYIASLAHDIGFVIQRCKSIIPRTDASKDIDGRIYILEHLPNCP